MQENDGHPSLASLLANLPAASVERRKGKLHGSTVAVLRNMIVTGALAPGMRLNERELCEQLAVSRTPIREAIKTLMQDGLLHASPNHSAIVSELDPAEVEALIDVLMVIEGLAGELAAKHVDDVAIAEIGVLHYQMVLHHSRNELPNYFAANKAFHRKIVELSRNNVLIWIWDLLALRVDRARYSSNRWPVRWKTAIQEHQQILDALTARDADLTASRMRDHVRSGLSGLVELLKTDRASPKSDASQGNHSSDIKRNA